MITISVGQAILLLLDKHRQNAGVWAKLSLFYLRGVETALDLEVIQSMFESGGFTKEYQISTDPLVIDEDASRRYFETHLAFETLRDSLDHLDADQLLTYYSHALSKLNNDEVEKYLCYLNGIIQPATGDPLAPFAREYLDAMKKVREHDNYAHFNPLQREKLELILKCSWLGVMLAKKMPLNIYGVGLFSDSARGKIIKEAPQSCNTLPYDSCHFGLMRRSMSLPRFDIARTEKGFGFLRPADQNKFNPEAEWPKKNFAKLVHPYSCSLSGTLLAQLRFMTALMADEKMVFNTKESFTTYIKCLTSALLFNSGGHSYNEFFGVFEVEAVKDNFKKFEWFSSVNMEVVLLNGNLPAFMRALNDTISYHKAVLAKQAAHVILPNQVLSPVVSRVPK